MKALSTSDLLVKLLLSGLLACSILAGCATSTVQSRKNERPAAYAALSPELRALVDQGQIKVGMNMDAVYLAWGKPAQVLQQEDASGAVTTWLYEGGWMEENRYWYHRRLMYDYQPRTFVRAEIVFAGGLVREWRTLPQPSY